MAEQATPHTIFRSVQPQAPVVSLERLAEELKSPKAPGAQAGKPGLRGEDWTSVGFPFEQHLPQLLKQLPFHRGVPHPYTRRGSKEKVMIILNVLSGILFSPRPPIL